MLPGSVSSYLILWHGLEILQTSRNGNSTAALASPFQNSTFSWLGIHFQCLIYFFFFFCTTNLWLFVLSIIDTESTVFFSTLEQPSVCLNTITMSFPGFSFRQHDCWITFTLPCLLSQFLSNKWLREENLWSIADYKTWMSSKDRS